MIQWPEKYNIFGVDISAVDYKKACECIIKAAKKNLSACVDHMPVHGLITASNDKYFNNHIKNFDIVAPDGQPVRWALNHFHRTNLTERVYGPDLMLILCEEVAEKGISIYLYGSTSKVINKLKKKLIQKFRKLKIAGMESPPFRKLSLQEDKEMIERINKSGAGITFISLGCPKQEVFASEHKGKINSVMVCVGAAFDFHAGVLDQAPAWMQKRGLEWLFRIFKEPKRLFKRYLITNSIYIFKFLKWKIFRINHFKNNKTN